MGTVDTDRRKFDTGGFIESDATHDCHAMRKSFHLPMVSFPPDPKENVFTTITGFAAPYHVPTLHHIR